ncbi:Uncharacterized protein C0J52_17203 [Blattella germanica]|nr:Uncharacterized protein C0J52_17203 [Blattella germanica]
MSAEVVVARKKRVSKKNKKSWRKHTDTKDVDSFLDDQRLEERLGKPFADRQDDELFEIDTVGHKEELVSTKRTKKKLKPIKCFSILENQSAVPDPITKRNRVRTAEERKHPLVKKIENDRNEKGILKRKKIVSIKDQLLAREKKLNKPKKGDFKFDLWETDYGNTLNSDSTWLTPTTLFHTLKNTGKLKKKIPEKFLDKPYSAPAMEAPHPGLSYNPSYHDHQELLSEVVNKELELRKEEKHLKRVTSKMFYHVSVKDRENQWMDEMSQGLPNPDKQETNEESESDSEYTSLSVNPPVKNKKKTLKARRKLKEAKKAALQQKHQKTEKKKVSDIYKAKKPKVKLYEKKSHKMGWESKGY